MTQIIQNLLAGYTRKIRLFVIRGTGIVAFSITSDKSRWLKMKGALVIANSKELQIGFFKEDSYDSNNGNLPVALVAAWQDLGAPFVGEKHIPARPFMSVGLKTLLASPVYTRKYMESYLNILDNNSTAVDEYGRIALTVVPELRDIVDKWSDPPNAPATIKKKGENNPLIDTGKMRDSVKAKVRGSR